MTVRLENICLNETDSIKQAMQLINEYGTRGAIVSSDDQLKGIVTDGDIRRGMLAELSLDDSVSKIMNTAPVVASSSFSKKEIISICDKHNIFVLPVLDEEQKLVNVYLHNKDLKSTLDNPVVIMAGGFGSRLRPLTENCPKPMLKVGSKPMLEILINNFYKAGFRNIYISTFYLSEVIKNYFRDGSDWGVNITYINETKPLGTAGALGLIKDNIDSNLPLILTNADILTTANYSSLLDYHNQNDAIATMTVREFEYQIPYGVIQSQNQKISEIIEKPKQKIFINAGLYVVEPELLKQIPSNEVLDMPSLLSQQIDTNKDVNMFPLYEYWLDIGRMEDYQRAQIDMLTLNV